MGHFSKQEILEQGWHEGEGCSVNSCCCDPMEASQ